MNGFKLSPIVGQWLAQFVLTGEKPDDMQYFAYDRFTLGSEWWSGGGSRDDMQYFAYDRFTRGKEIRPRYASGVLG